MGDSKLKRREKDRSKEPKEACHAKKVGAKSGPGGEVWKVRLENQKEKKHGWKKVRGEKRKIERTCKTSDVPKGGKK